MKFQMLSNLLNHRNCTLAPASLRFALVTLPDCSGDFDLTVLIVLPAQALQLTSPQASERSNRENRCSGLRHYGKHLLDLGQVVGIRFLRRRGLWRRGSVANRVLTGVIALLLCQLENSA